MDTQRNVQHYFDLTGLSSGDSFLGCPQCWFRFSATELAKPQCPECRAAMKIYYVTDEDIELRDWKDALGYYSANIRSKVQSSGAPASWIYMFGQFWYVNDPPERKVLFRKLLEEHEPEMAAWIIENQPIEINDNSQRATPAYS